jgi:hypothetical protein
MSSSRAGSAESCSPDPVYNLTSLNVTRYTKISLLIGMLAQGLYLFPGHFQLHFYILAVYSKQGLDPD